jgi:peroxiredoxin
MQTASTSLQSQIEAFNAQAKTRLSEDVVTALTSPIKQLIDGHAAERALKVGMRAPDFALPEARGAQVSLSELLKSGPVIIAFYRGEWCPYCNLQLRAYQQILPEMHARGASLIAISPQTPDHSLSMAEKNDLAFRVLSDVDNAVARKFGLAFSIDESVRDVHAQVGANLPAFNGTSSWELPMPGTFIVDQTRMIRLAFVDPDFTRRLEPAAILDALDHIRAGG